MSYNKLFDREPCVAHVGYLFVGRFTETNNRWFKVWKNMLEFAYKKGSENSVDKQWHNFQNFAEWCEENLEKVCLAKFENHFNRKEFGPHSYCK